VSTPRCVHLLCAGEALAEGYRPGGFLVLCGELIGTSSLSGARCPQECECEVTYCPGCLDVATQRNWEAGIAVSCPPAITVVTGVRPEGRR
jgi:hypothetical protein